MGTFLLCLADVLLILAGVVYGLKFIKTNNYLLGIEWLIMATSGTNFLLWAIFGWQHCYDAAHFFDAFSRSVGFPIVALIGMMAVTHDYKPSKAADVAYFVVGFLVAGVLVFVEGYPDWVVYKAPFYIAMMFPFTIYLGYCIVRLVHFGEFLHAAGVFAVCVSGALIAVSYDYVPIPGDDADRSIFYTAALTTWAFMMFELYYAYRALERHTRRGSKRVAAHPVHPIHLARGKSAHK